MLCTHTCKPEVWKSGLYCTILRIIPATFLPLRMRASRERYSQAQPPPFFVSPQATLSSLSRTKIPYPAAFKIGQR